eukprot:scaffold18043_cov46-Attheya_sp.AAC.6
MRAVTLLLLVSAINVSTHSGCVYGEHIDQHRIMKKKSPSSVNSDKKQKEDLGLEKLKSKQLILTDNFAEKVTKKRETKKQELDSILQNFEEKRDAIQSDDPDAAKKSIELYNTYFEEMRSINEITEVEIGADQAYLADKLALLNIELLEMKAENDDLEMVRDDLEKEVQSLKGNFNDPVCCIVDDIKYKIEDPKKLELFTSALQLEFNQILLETDANVMVIGMELLRQDWMRDIQFGLDDLEHLLNGPTATDNGNDRRLLSSTGQRLVMQLNANYTCGSYCPKSCDENELKKNDIKNIERFCTASPAVMSPDIIGKLNKRIQDLFLYQPSLAEFVQKNEVTNNPEIAVSCASCGEWDTNEGFQSYVNPSLLKGLKDYLKAVDTLMDQEQKRTQQFDQHVLQCKQTWVNDYEKSDMSETECLQKANTVFAKQEGATRKRKLGKSKSKKKKKRKKKKRSSDKKSDLAAQVLDAQEHAAFISEWSLALVGCSDDAIRVFDKINESFHDCIGEGQIRLDSQMASLVKKHEGIYNNLSQYLRDMSRNGEDELRRNLEQVKEDEAEARVRVQSRRKALAFHVVDYIVCDIEGMDSTRALNEPELLQVEKFFMKAMDNSFMRADIDLRMIKASIDKDCVVDPDNQSIENCFNDEGTRRSLRIGGKSYKSRRRRLRFHSLQRCNFCRPRWLQPDTVGRRYQGRGLQTVSKELADPENADFFVKYANKQFKKYISLGLRHLITDKSEFDVRCLLEEEVPSL